MTRLPHPDQTFREAGIAWMRRQNAELLRRLPGTLDGEDPEELHDMRVASRRLRAAMLLFEPVFPPRVYRKWYRRVSAITDALGATRDADVQGEAVRRRQASLPENEQADVDVWLIVHQDRRTDARVEMVRALTDWRNRDMSGRFARVLCGLGSQARLARRSEEVAAVFSEALEAPHG